VYESARSYAGGSALDVRSLRGHSALALALAGLEVRSYDTNAKDARHREGLISRHNLNVDFRVGRFDGEFDLPETYNVVLHDAEHGDRTRPELEKLWNRKVRPGGLLIVHDVNQLNLSALLDAIAPLDHFVSEDENGRKMGYFRKP
jgi:predicted O-methyltransferase YrrM